MTTPDVAKLETAFALVCPATEARDLAERGIISPEAAAQASWRDPIAALVTEAELAAAGVTIADVVDAVGFYTATQAVVRPCTIAGVSWVSYIGGAPGFFVQAIGYRQGPAGP